MDKYYFNPQLYKEQLKSILNEIEGEKVWIERSLRPILVKYPKDGNGLFSNDQLVAGYQLLVSEGTILQNSLVEERIKMKPTRTISGVATVTVLTKPFPCPGKCIFCPNDVRMPKSYLRDEPGAQRAEKNRFDPYMQTYNRLLALQKTGHNIEKIELIVLGGTWSFYPEDYQIWFIKRCFEAMNDFDANNGYAKEFTGEEPAIEPGYDNLKAVNYNLEISKIKNNSEFEKTGWKDLFSQHKINETAYCKCVGLVVETRPDYINEAEVICIRKLGATKVQIGIQSLNDEILVLNKRGHDVDTTKNAIRLLRLAGFKIHAHWMPNLYGSDVKKDIIDYMKLWSEDFSPDELKIYPTSIIANTELYERYLEGVYQPYSYDELLEVLVNTIPLTPRYCRLTRIIRDIPSTDIIAGNMKTNFRQIAEEEITKKGGKCQCIRCREIKGKIVTFEDLELEVSQYETNIGLQYFISFKTKTDDNIAGFLRLSLPKVENYIDELKGKAMIREIHVYGQVVGIGKEFDGKSQHIGLGTKLIEIAKQIALENKYQELSVISAIGTRGYYRKKGFVADGLYMKTTTFK
ncbi:MAG: tRNA uridine(34) 5-carboxymethylaminomethyl modification radical SAM/GNAT enzyme Elp3 [bacterium]